MMNDYSRQSQKRQSLLDEFLINHQTSLLADGKFPITTRNTIKLEAGVLTIAVNMQILVVP
jgi:hypothetical protein